MNKSYKVVYSKARGKLVAVSEITRACMGKLHSSKVVSVSALVAALGAAVMAVPAEATTYKGTVNPETGKVTIDIGGGNSIEISGVGLVSYTGSAIWGKNNLKSPDAKRPTYGWSGIALGTDALASGRRSIAIGQEAEAFGIEGDSVFGDSVAIGYTAKAQREAIAIGRKAEAANNGVAIGSDNGGSIRAATSSVAIGSSTWAQGSASIALGPSAWAESSYAISIGWDASGRGRSASAIGYDADAYGEQATAIGYKAHGRASYALALGSEAEVKGGSSNAIGYKASATGMNANAIGSGASATSYYSNAFGYKASAAGSSNAIGFQATADSGSSNAIGYKASSSGSSSNAIGDAASASGFRTNALGYKASSAGEYSNAFGDGATSAGKNSNALGSEASSSGEDSIAIGSGASVAEGAWGSSAIGWHASVAKANSLAYGDGSKATGNYSSAVGSNAEAAEMANAFGYQALATESRAVALGNQTKATGYQSVALGIYAEAWNENSLALGALSVADEDKTVSVGRSAASGRGKFERRIVNVADGTKATDAATVGQLQTVSKKADEKYLNLDSTKDGTTGITNNELSINASDAIASGTTALATVKAVYDEVRPTADGAYVKAGETTGKNLSALDKQVKKNAGDIENLRTDTAADLTNYAKADGSNVAAGSAATWAEKIGTGAVASGNNLLITGDKVYAEVRPTANGTYVKTAQSTAANLKALDKQVSDNSSLLGYLSVNATGNTVTPSTSAKASGPHALALGEKATASDYQAAAIGYSARASGLESTAVGYYSIAFGDKSSAFGTSTASGEASIAIGYTAKASASNAAAIGYMAEASKNSAQAIGYSATASGDSSIALGFVTKASGFGAIAFGSNAAASSNYSIALGNHAAASSDYSIAFGTDAVASGQDSVALGHYAVAKAKNAFVLGTDSVADEENTISVGRTAEATTNHIGVNGKAITRRIVNVAEGTAASNAATVSQTATVESAGPASSFLTVDGTDTNDNGSKRYKLSLTMSDDVNGETEGLVTNKTVKAALASLSTGVASDYAAIDASNLTGHESDWANVIGTGVIRPAADTAQSRALLVTGTAVYDEVKLSRDGDFAKIEKTTGDNLLALDDKIKDIVSQISQNDSNLAQAKQEFQRKINEVSGKAQDAQDAADAAKDAADAAQGTANNAVADAAAAMTEAKKHTTVTSDGTIKVEKGVSAETGGAEYKLSIAEGADFTAKQTTWKSEDGKTSTANSSGFFSGGTSAADSNAYVSDGVVSAGKSESTKIVLDGNTGKASFGSTVTIDGSTGRISGLAAGEVSETSTDAVNGAQLYEVQQGVAQNAQGLESLGRAVNKVDRKIDRTGALAAALAGLHPQDYDEDHPVSGAVGIGHYKGKQALAVGMFVRPVENFMVSLGASGSADDYMLNAGASFRFGGPTMKKSPQQMAARLSDQEVTIRDLSAQNLAQKTRLESQDEKLLKQASEIKDQKAEISAQKARLESQDAKLERQASEIEQLKAMMAKIQAKLGK